MWTHVHTWHLLIGKRKREREKLATIWDADVTRLEHFKLVAFYINWKRGGGKEDAHVFAFFYPVRIQNMSQKKKKILKKNRKTLFRRRRRKKIIKRVFSL